MAPILLLSFLTGAMMALPAVEALVLRPFASPAELAAERKPPRAQWPPLVQSLDWAGVIETARDRYPQAVLRVIGLPAKPGAPITIRVRQPGEWVPNGSTLLWFDPATGRLIGERDVRRLSRGVRLITLIPASRRQSRHFGVATGADVGWLGVDYARHIGLHNFLAKFIGVEAHQARHLGAPWEFLRS